MRGGKFLNHVKLQSRHWVFFAFNKDTKKFEEDSFKFQGQFRLL